MSESEDFVTPPLLGPELASGKWKVHVIDGDNKITEEVVSGKEVWSMRNRRVVIDFNRKGQPIKDSGGLFGSWLGSLSHDLHLLPINYTDWRKVSNYRKEMAWKVIQKKFWFDDPNRRKKYVLSTLGCRCRDLKQRLWKEHRRNTPEESFQARPGLVPEDQWKEFVEQQFTDKSKRMRERNMKSSRSKQKIPHALGKKSIARKADEMEEETGKEPNRGEIFIVSRTRADGTLVSNEARVSVDKLKEVMSQNIQSEASSHETRPKDAFEQVFGSESSGRVRCLGRGPTPSKYFSNFKCNSSDGDIENIIIDMKARLDGFQEKLETITDTQANINGFEEKLTSMQANINGFGQKLDIVSDALYAIVKRNSKDEKKMLNLHQSSSVNSDQESGISKT